jgi:uncharacterized protein with HEPN domain
MEIEISKWLVDVLDAIDEIESFITDSKNFSDFQKDQRTKRAVERNIEIIGEAMSRIVGVSPDIKISDTRKIIDTRNRIIHGYDSVSDEVLWSIIVRNLPLLKLEVSKLLDQ